MCCPSSNKRITRAARQVGHIVKGFGYLAGGINNELSAERMKICKACPELRNGLSCNICGCVVEAKTRLNDESCPIGKWLPKQ
jgi:hypothetical protein